VLDAAASHEIGVDWHGHRDRGWGWSLHRSAAGQRPQVHGTALGIGGRCGSAEMDLLLVNLRLLGWIGAT
jgi:2-isopropylmalate synthase